MIRRLLSVLAALALPSSAGAVLSDVPDFRSVGAPSTYPVQKVSYFSQQVISTAVGSAVADVTSLGISVQPSAATGAQWYPFTYYRPGLSGASTTWSIFDDGGTQIHLRDTAIDTVHDVGGDSIFNTGFYGTNTGHYEFNAHVGGFLVLVDGALQITAGTSGTISTNSASAFILRNTAGPFSFTSFGDSTWEMNGSALKPANNGNSSLGTAALRFNNVYALALVSVNAMDIGSGTFTRSDNGTFSWINGVGTFATLVSAGSPIDTVTWTSSVAAGSHTGWIFNSTNGPATNFAIQDAGTNRYVFNGATTGSLTFLAANTTSTISGSNGIKIVSQNSGAIGLNSTAATNGITFEAASTIKGTIDTTNARFRIGDATVPATTLDVAGTLQVTGSSGLITKINNETTAGVGTAYERGSTKQKAETGADTNVLTVTPASATGQYRICISMQVSAQNTATLGWTATWTDSNGSAQAPTNLALNQTGVAAPALTFTAATNGNYWGVYVIDVNNAGTNIVVKTTFTGTSIGYNVSATVERI